MRMDQHIKRLIEKYTFEASRLTRYDALDKYNMAYAQAKELGNAFTIRACAANLGAMYVSLGKKEDAEKGLNYLLEAIPPEGTTDGVSNGDLYFNFGLGCEVLGRYREAASYLERAWQEYKGERDNLAMEMDTLKRLVQISLVRQKYEEAVKWYVQQEETYGRANRPKDRLLAMVQRIGLQQRLGEEDLSEAVEECCDMMQSVRQQGITVGILVQVSVLLTQFKLLDKARQYLEEALALFEAEDDRSMERAVVLQNLGTICNYLDDWDTSLEYHKKAADIYQYYATLSPNPKSPIQPRSAQRCQGHCLANYAYALVHFDDLDEARVQFEKARELAEQSDDTDTKWQMEEALGAVHFRMACHDLDLPFPLSAETRVQLPLSRLEHLKKSIKLYKSAYKNLMSAPRGTSKVQDRVLEKLTLVQTFERNASQAPAGHFVQTALHFGQLDNARETSAVKSSESGEEQSEEEEEEDIEEGEKDSDDSSDEEDSNNKQADEEDGPRVAPPNMRSLPQRPSLQHIRLGKTMRTPMEEDEGQTQMKALYAEQLGTATLQGSGVHHTVQADIHAQHEKHHSSSAESGSSDSDDEDEDDDDDDEEDEEEEEDEDDDRQVPPVPSQSPPRTMQASGTYETPQQAEMHINDLYGRSHSRPRSPPPRSANYAEIDFDTKNQARQGELAPPSDRRFSLNHFLNSSDDDVKKTTKQRKPEGGSQDPDYEPVDMRQGSPQQASAHSSKAVGFEMGGSCLSHGSNKEQKDSKTCRIM